MKKSSILKAFLFGSVLCVSAVTAQATLLVYDDFSYSVPDQTSIAGLNGGTGWGGAWVTNAYGTPSVASGQINIRNLGAAKLEGYKWDIGPNSLRVNAQGAGGNAIVSRALGTALAVGDRSGSSYYLSSAFYRIDSDSTNGTEQVEFAFMQGSTQLLNMGFNNFEVAKIQYGAETALDPNGTIYPINNNYLLIGQITNNTDGTVTLRFACLGVGDVLPTDEASMVWNVEVENVVLTGSVDKLEIRVGRYAQQGYFDNILIGTSFSDIAIPEPSMAALGLGLLGLMVVAVRRRR